MSEESASPSDESDTESAGPAVRRDRPLGDVGLVVNRRLTQLLTTRDRPTTVATLARLRANVGREPGADPTIWAVTVDGVPGNPSGDAPTPQERAAHAALTLFALHQQARSEPMHRPGVGLGRAVGRLARARPRGDDGPSPVRRRFDAAVTSSGFDELTHHLRGLVTQMRGEGIGLDYAALADDLHRFQIPAAADGIRRRWARQLYRGDTERPATTHSETDDTDPIETKTTEEHE